MRKIIFNKLTMKEGNHKGTYLGLSFYKSSTANEAFTPQIDKLKTKLEDESPKCYHKQGGLFWPS